MTNTELVQKILDCLEEGEDCIGSERVASLKEHDQLEADFTEARNNLKRIVEQFDSLHRTFEKWADEWDATGTAEVYGPDMARWMREKWREALNPASRPEGSS